MNYSFCNINYHLNDLEVSKNSIYDTFRNREDNKSDCEIKISIVNELEIPKKQSIFENIQGFHVVVKDNIEYRYYSDFFTGEINQLLMDDGTKKELQILKDSLASLTELQLLNCLAFEKSLSEHGKFILHSSFIETSKGAILFTAPSGTGKSTQADLWHQYRGTEIINGDRSGIWREGDTWMAGGVPWCGTSGIMKNKVMPLRAIVILKQGPENVIQNVRFASKVGRILEQITVNPWNKEMLLAAQTFCMLLCQEVPILQLSCRPDLGAVEVLERELEKYNGE